MRASRVILTAIRFTDSTKLAGAKRGAISSLWSIAPGLSRNTSPDRPAPDSPLARVGPVSSCPSVPRLDPESLEHGSPASRYQTVGRRHAGPRRRLMVQRAGCPVRSTGPAPCLASLNAFASPPAPVCLQAAGSILSSLVNSAESMSWINRRGGSGQRWRESRPMGESLQPQSPLHTPTTP